jgi:hypothetical protein
MTRAGQAGRTRVSPDDGAGATVSCGTGAMVAAGRVVGAARGVAVAAGRAVGSGVGVRVGKPRPPCWRCSARWAALSRRTG